MTVETPTETTVDTIEETTVETVVDASVTPDDAPQGNREARYRVERNEARDEATALAQRIEQLQTRELERIASKSLANPADLLTLSGKALADLLDDDGEVDPEKVQAVADEILGTRPGLKPRTPATDPSQGGDGNPGKFSPTWGTLLQS